jgi:hypothetical protein
MKTKPGLFLLAVLLFAATNAHAQDANFFIFLCFGQSNMEGFPGVEPQDKTVDDRFQVLATVDFPNMGRTKGNWYPAVPPLCRSTTGLCPADYFGRTLVSKLPANIRVGIVNVSVAGCNRGAPEWHPASGEIKAACACAAEFCRERGADIAQEDPVERVMEITQGIGVDCVIECVGHYHAIEGQEAPLAQAVKMIRSAGRIVTAGLGEQLSAVHFKTLVIKEAQIIASRVTLGEFPRALRLMSKGLLHPALLVTDQMALRDVTAAFAKVDSEDPNTIKVVLNVQEA